MASFLFGKNLLGYEFVQDKNEYYMKIDNVVMGNSPQFGYKVVTEPDVGKLLADQITDQSVVCLLYNWESGVCYIKSGFDLNNSNDYSNASGYTTFIVKNRVDRFINSPIELPQGPQGPQGAVIPTVPSVPKIPDWNGNGISYNISDKVTYNGTMYICVNFSHVSKPKWNPKDAFVLWEVYVEPITSGNSGFVKVLNGNFVLNGTPIKLVGPNAYWMGINEGYQYPPKVQIEEVFEVTHRLSGNSIRSHTLGHSSGSANSLRPRDNNLNINAWDSIDYAYSLANKYNIKLIVPLTDCYKWYNGGYGDYTATRGVPKRDFWTNMQVRADFKKYISDYLNHVNKYTGIAIKDDPALGLIELGNELGNIREGQHDSTTIPTKEWLTDISNYVRSIDSNHLILNPADECLGQSDDFNISALDVHSGHFYWEDYNRFNYGVEECRKIKKPYIVGEYSSFAKPNWYTEMEKRAVQGSFFWSLYPHQNGISGGNKIPHNDGFTIHYSKDNEKHLLDIANHFRRLQGLPQINSLDFRREITFKPSNTIPTFPSTPSGPVVPSTPSGPVVPSTPSGPTTPSGPSVPSVPSVPTSNWNGNFFNYKTGDIVIYNGVSYSCRQPHTSQPDWNPKDVLSLWVISNSGNVINPVPTTPVIPIVPVTPVTPTVPTVPMVPVIPTVPMVPVIPTVPTIPVSPVIPTVPVTNQSKKRCIYYHANWSTYARNYQIKDIPKEVTDISYAFFNLDAQGNVIQGDSWADTEKRFSDGVEPQDSWNDPGVGFYGNFGQIKKIQNSGRKLDVSLSIGGWTWSKNFSPAVSTVTTRTNFVNNIINIFKTYTIFSGVSIDWEYVSDDGINYGSPGNIATKEDSDNLALFLIQLRNSLINNGMSNYSIAMCTIADPTKCKFNLEKIHPLLDEIHVMTYDFHDGNWGETVSKFHTNPRKSPFSNFSCEEASDYYLSRGVSSTKLFIGVAFYSRGYSNTDGIGKSSSGGSSDRSWDVGSVDYKQLPLPGATEYNDPVSKAAYSYDPVKKVINTYDNPNSVIEKCKIVYEKNLGGIIVWESSADYPYNHPRSLMKTLHDNLTNGRPST